MDCIEAVKLIQSSSLDRLPHVIIVNEFKRFFDERVVTIVHVSRSQNVVSHYLATFGRAEGRTAVWLRSGPADVPMLCRSELVTH